MHVDCLIVIFLLTNIKLTLFWLIQCVRKSKAREEPHTMRLGSFLK